MCLGIAGRGNADEVDWDGENNSQRASRVESIGNDGWGNLSEWNGNGILSTQCTNAGAVIEWLFVPFIVEEDIDEDVGEEGVSVAEIDEDVAEEEILVEEIDEVQYDKEL